MGWETRKGSKGSYYTRSRRVDGRVVREYIGTGPVAEFIADLDELERYQQQMERDKFKREREAQSSIDRKIDEETRLIQALTRAVLLVNGYHRHKGQWRKKNKFQL
jgi:hypothetical protein